MNIFCQLKSLPKDLQNMCMEFHPRQTACCQIITEFKEKLLENDHCFDIFFSCLQSEITEEMEDAFYLASVENTIEKAAPNLKGWFAYKTILGWHRY